MVQYSSCLKYKRLSTSVPWEQWWSFGYRHFLRAQKEAYVALSSLADVSQVVDRQLQPSGESHSENVIVIFARLFTDSDFQILSAVLNEKRFQSLHWLFLCLAPCWPRLGYVGFPLDNMAVVAEVSSLRPGAEVAFWDVYQPAPHLPQRASVVRRWPLRDLLCPDCPGNATSAAGLPGREEEGDGGGGVALGFPREPWARRTNLTGLVVRCTALPGAPHTYLQDNPDGGVKISGIYGELWDALRDILNFTQRCTRPPDGGWGALRNGSWTGMIGELVKGEADVAVAPLDKTYIRSLVVDYPHPLSLEGYVLVIKRPQGSSSTWNSYLREFQPSSWLVLCAVLAALTVVLTFLGRLSPDETAMSAGDAVLVTIAALCQLGTDAVFSSISSRILFITLYLTCVLVYMFYTSFLISALTVNKVSLPFRDLQGMFEKKTHTFGFHGGGSLEDYFRTSSIQVNKNIWTEMVLPNPHSLQQARNGLQQVLEGRHAFMTNKVFFLSKYFHCGFYILPGDYFLVAKTWPMRRGSPLFPVFNHHMIAMAESGLVVKSSRRWMPRGASCESSSVDAIGLATVMTAFLLLGSAAALASGLVLLERLSFNKGP
ncbi:glutamate receptor isoform X2 [Penaeus vannamei]|uniref:glutamate receptor isoform X2 n=1 Tax=Penaeus vannamei TaxID=6689 RepID=UPI00387FA0FC